MDIKQFLQKKLAAELTQITHQSLNRTFAGYSNAMQQQVFIKVFTQKIKFMTEKTVNQELNKRVLDSFTIADTPQLFVLVMTDLAPLDLKQQVTPELAFEMGVKLAQFHQQVKPFTGIYPNNNLFAKAEWDIAHLEKLAVREQLHALLNCFDSLKLVITTDLHHCSTTVLHGDVGVRNYKLINDQLALIDFERARMGVNYQDFIKLFYQDFSLDPDMIDAFLSGYHKSGIQVKISQLTQIFLIFITAIGIMCYTDKVVDQDFEKVGLKMLETVEHFFNEDSTNVKDLMNAVIK